MSERYNTSSFVNDYASFTSIQQVADGHHALSHAADMADVGSVVVVACTALAITFALKNTFRSRQFMKERAAFKRLPVAARAAFVSLMVAVIAYGGAKPGTNTLEKITRPLAVLMNSGEQLDYISNTVSLTENQLLAGFALTAVVTNETFDLSAPSNATVHANWLKRGAAEDGFWVPVGTFLLGTNRVESVYVSSSGTLSFNRPKSSPSARLMPDGSSIAFLAPLQTVLGIPPESRWNLITNYELRITNSLFWYDVTDSGSARFTWQNALLGRETNAPVSFQAELFPSGDFVFKYDFSAITNRQSQITNYVIGAQNYGGGEIAIITTSDYHCTRTNHLCASLYSLDGTNVLTTPLCTVITNSPKFSLHWTAFGNYNPSDPDPDNDGIPTVEEILLYHTNPNMPDTDLDGISDGDEVASGFNPLSRDTDGDGLVDGSDPDPLSVTPLDDLDGDGIPDTYEIFMFGSTNTVGSLAYDPGETGFPLSTKIAAGMDPETVAAEEITPAKNLASLKLFDAFRCDFTNTQNTLYSRTINIDRDGGWQQYFISSAPDKAEPWKLDGMTLEWSDSGGGSGTVTTSPQDDSFYLPVSTNSPANLTLTLRSTSPNSICSQPLYLLTWSPTIEASGAAQATIDGSVCYAVEWEDEGGSIGIQYDLSNRPCHAEPTDLELAARLNPFPGETRLVFTPTIAGGAGATGGMLSSKAPGAFAIPSTIQMAETKTSSSQPLDTLRTMRSASTRGGDGDDGGFFIFFDPEISYGNGHSGGCGSTLLFDTGTATYSKTYEYPLNSGCLWRSWHRDTSGTYSCNCKAVITYGDESLKDYFEEDIEDDGTYATGTILFGGNAIWQGEAWHHTDDGGCVESGVEQLSSDGCDACSSGCADGNCDNLEGDSLNSLAFRIPLGMPRDSQISGFLWFKSAEPLAIMPSTFNLLTRDDAAVTDTTLGGTRTVTCSDSRGRTAIIDSIATGVRITMRQTADNSLEHTWEIVNVNGSSSVIHLRKISRLNNVMRDVTYTYANGDWVAFDNIVQSSEQIVRTDTLNSGTNGVLREVRIIRNASNAILSHTITDSRRYGFGESAVIREIYHSTLGIGEDRIEDYATYWEDNENTRRNGRPRLIWGESRAWSYQTHDTEGRETLRLDQLDGSEVPFGLDGNTPPDFHEVSCVSWLSSLSLTAIATVSDYTPLPSDSSHLADLDTVRTESRYLVRSGAPTLIGRTWRIYNHDADALGRSNVTVQTIRAGSQESTIGDPSNAVSIETHFNTDAPNIPLLLRGRSVSFTDEDGTITTYDYALGTWDDVEQAFLPVVNGAHLRTLVSRSTAAAPNGIPGKSTKTLTIQDATHGTTLYTATLLGSTGDVLSWQSNTYDDKNRLRSTLYSDGSSTTNAYSCCRLLWTIDRNGNKVLRSAITGKDHLYYAMEEVSLAELPRHETYIPYENYQGGHRVTQHFMDALGRETNTVITAARAEGDAVTPTFLKTGSSLVTSTTFPYGTSDYSISTDGRGVRTVVSRTGYPDKTESVSQKFHPTNLVNPILESKTTSYHNGRSVSERIWATGWSRETSITKYGGNGCRVGISFAEVSDVPNAITNSVVQYDFLGSAASMTTPGTGGTVLTMTNTYDGASSRLLRSETAGRPSTVQLYDALGEQVGSIYNGVVSATDSRYETIEGDIWKVTDWTSATTNGVTNSVTTVKKQMTGLSNVLRSRTVSIAENGYETRTESLYDPATKTLTQVSATDDATPTIETSMFGRTIERVGLHSRDLAFFDPHGRTYMKETYHPTTDAFVTDWWGLYDASGNGVAFDSDIGSALIEGNSEFDPWNRETIRTDALGNAVTNVYDDLGRLIEASGAVYPVSYGYDASGRMTSLSTQYGQDAAVSRTSWIHDPRTGLATAKEYDDETQIAYTHTPDGRPHRTTWARGAWREHEYDERELLAEVAYSDSRLNTFHAYDAFGHVITSSNSTARYAYENSTLGIATNESVSIGAKSFTIARGLDSRQRLLRLEADGYVAFYDYDSENRLATVSNGVFTASYQYATDGLDAGSTMVLTNGITLTRVVVRDPFRRQLITLVSNTVETAAISAYGYEYDSLARATSRNFDSFGYNARSEVTTANVASNEYGYAYDNTGNHLFNTVNTVTNTYEVNALNQYTNINYFVGSIQPVYDLDGNMGSNGVWSYTWDAANQLTAAYSNSVCVVSNAYDHGSRRVVKVTPTATHTFIYDGWNLVQETVASASGIATNAYVWGKDLSGMMQGAGGIGGLLAVKQGNAWYFPLYDNNGNITAYIDESGSVVAEYVYDAFGGLIASSGSMVDEFFHRFSTKYLDKETGLYYYGYRFYSSDLHRWLSRDPIVEHMFLFAFFCDFELYQPANADEPFGVFNVGDENYDLVYANSSEYWDSLTGGEESLYVYLHNDALNHVDYLGLVDLNMFPEKEKIKKYADKAKTVDGSFSIGAHGNPTTVLDSDGKAISAKELAKKILATPNYESGQKVVLGSCNTGVGANSYAKQLADELTKQSCKTTVVQAPNTFAWYNSEGKVLAAGMTKDKKRGTKGAWIMFSGESK